MPQPTPWPDNERQTLQEMWPTNSSGTIAKFLGRTRNAVIGMARRMNLPPKAPAGGGYHPKPGMVRKKPTLKVIHRKPSLSPVYLGPVPLLEAKPYHCRAVVAEKGEDGLAMFCGKPIKDGQAFSFCSEHLERFTTKGYVK